MLNNNIKNLDASQAIMSAGVAAFLDVGTQKEIQKILTDPTEAAKPGAQEALVLVEGLSGCVSGAVSGGNCAQGAEQGAASAIFGELLALSTTPDPNLSSVQQQQQKQLQALQTLLTNIVANIVTNLGGNDPAQVLANRALGQSGN